VAELADATDLKSVEGKPHGGSSPPGAIRKEYLMSGKGDRYRDVDRKKYDKEYEKIFGKKKLNIMSDKESNDNMGNVHKRRKKKANKSSVSQRRQSS
tara:strand:- start:49992 stop:50282 length:291 start_codon:yes stop_codon:yes gene_type:complete